MDKSKLKQRLVGVLVLTALVALVVPWVIDLQQEKDLLSDKISLPEKSDKDAVTHVIPLQDLGDQAQKELDSVAVTDDEIAEAKSLPADEHGATGQTEAEAAAQVVSAATSSSSTGLQEIGTEPKQPADESAKAAGTAVPAAPRIKEGWVVQLATLSNEKSALELRDRMRSLGHKAFIEKVQNAQGDTLLRVRIGPEATRERAEALRSEVVRQTKLKAIVQRYP